MFYGQFILGKKGPLAKIWFAAHLEKKLSRSEILATDVGSAIEEVIRPKIKLSLRLNGNLLLGIVRIYAKKASYILHDLERARKIFHHFVAEKEHQRRRVRRIAAGPEASTILEEDEEGEGMEMEITLPRMDEFAHPPGPEFNGRANNSDITLHEENVFFDNAQLSYLDGVFEPEAEELDQRVEDLEQLMMEEVDRMSRPNSALPELRARMEQDLMEQDLNEDSLLEEARRMSASNTGEIRLLQPELKEATHGGALEEMSRLRGGSLNGFDQIMNEQFEPMEAESFAIPDEVVGEVVQSDETPSNIPLDPLSSSQIRQALVEEREEQQRRRAPRRRRVQHLVADQNTSLDDDEMRTQMNNIKDILVDQIDIAPPSKRVMKAKEIGSLANIFNNPATDIAINPAFMKFYTEHCVPKARPLSDVPTAEQIREDMAFAAEPQLDAEEIRRSRASSRPPSVQLQLDNTLMDLNESMLQANDNAFIENNSLMNMDKQKWHEPQEYEEEDRENKNPFWPAKRSRTEKELLLDEKRARESAQALLGLIKSESSRVGRNKLNFNELILPNATNPEQIKQLPANQRRSMAKEAAHQFYALLELRKTREVQVEQSAAYQPIFVTLT